MMINQEQRIVPEAHTILVVDDSPANLELLLVVLNNSGFNVLLAKNGEKALEQLESIRPDIILLDVMMPGMNGFEICRLLKTSDETKNIPVIIMSALSDIKDKVEGFNAGAVDYITKPIQHQEVVARVTTHLTIQSLQKGLREQNVRLQQEIAERRQIEEKQERLIAELDAFAHTVAHDLKNPLSAILRLSTSLEDYHTRIPSEKLGDYLHSLTRAGQKAANIVKELLLLAGVRKGDVSLESLEMATIIKEVQQRLSYMIEEYQPEIILPDTWPAVWGYGPWIEEVWINYFSNALKYGGTPARVEFGATVLEDVKGTIRFWIRDNGDGLSLQDQKKLFAPFTRLAQTRAEGHGLGLSIVRRIIEKLGGQVGVESAGQPGQGTVFYFTLPGSPSNTDSVDR